MTGMSEAERARLREVAEAATPGPWWLATDGEPWSGDQAMTVDLDARAAAGEVVDEEWDVWHATDTGSLFHGDVNYAPDGVFVATFDPPTVLELLNALASRDARLAAVEADVRRVIEAHQRSVVRAGGPCICGRWPSLGTTWPEHVSDEFRRAALHSDPSEGM